VPGELDYTSDGRAVVFSVRLTPWHREGAVLPYGWPLRGFLAPARRRSYHVMRQIPPSQLSRPAHQTRTCT
jgi:hypothetical protein